MTSEGLGEMFEGDSANMCAGKFLLVSIGGRAEGLACADPGAMTPIGVRGNYLNKCKPSRLKLALGNLVNVNPANFKARDKFSPPF